MVDCCLLALPLGFEARCVICEINDLPYKPKERLFARWPFYHIHNNVAILLWLFNVAMKAEGKVVWLLHCCCCVCSSVERPHATPGNDVDKGEMFLIVLLQSTFRRIGTEYVTFILPCLSLPCTSPYRNSP